MPIQDTNVTEGPNLQDNGEYTGVMEFLFDDGRVVTRNVKAPDLTAWSNLSVDLPAKIQDEIADADADEVSNTDVEIAAYRQAGKKRVALAYLRRAYEIGDPYLAYLKFARFNDYRVTEGLSLGQVVAHLTSVGLTEDEWTDMRDRYQYLSQAGRVTTMVAYSDVLSGDTWGEQFR